MVHVADGATFARCLHVRAPTFRGRVRGRNLWIWYRDGGAVVELVALTAQPPGLEAEMVYRASQNPKLQEGRLGSLQSFAVLHAVHPGAAPPTDLSK